MQKDPILAAIDAEIARLTEVRRILASVEKSRVVKSAGGVVRAKRSKHNLSPEARARIAEAQRKRWAAARKGKK